MFALINQFFIFLLFLFLFQFSFATTTNIVDIKQKADPTNKSKRNYHNRKGTLYYSLGYNKANYSFSDVYIRQGDDIDFVVHNLTAKRQQEFRPYFIERLITEQPWGFGEPFDITIDYFLTHSIQLSLELRHFKYWSDQGAFKISGDLKDEKNLVEAVRDTTEFLKFEHTDGLSYLNVAGSYYWDLFSSSNAMISFYLGGGLGIAVPYSDINLYGQEDTSGYELAGFNIVLNGGFRLFLLKNFFIDWKYSYGYANLINIEYENTGISLSQQIRYVSSATALGFYF